MCDGYSHRWSYPHLWDSMSVINSTSKPESVLKKQYNAVCCYTVLESVAMGESLTTHIDGNENPANLLMNMWWKKEVDSK